MEWININGTRLEVRRIEAAGAAADRAPLVFLHEGLGSVAMWRDWPDQLCAATGRAGVVISRRGYGRSDAIPDVRGAPALRDGRPSGRLQPDYMHREAWEVLPPLLAHLNIGQPVLVGHSDGGTIALLHASRHPVAACVVMAPHVIAAHAPHTRLLKLPDCGHSPHKDQPLAVNTAIGEFLAHLP